MILSHNLLMNRLESAGKVNTACPVLKQDWKVHQSDPRFGPLLSQLALFKITDRHKVHVRASIAIYLVRALMTSLLCVLCNYFKWH